MAASNMLRTKLNFSTTLSGVQCANAIAELRNAVAQCVTFVELCTASCLLGWLDAPAVFCPAPSRPILDCQATAAGLCIFTFFMEESSLPGMGGSDGMSVLDLPPSTNDVRETGLSELSSDEIAVPSSFCTDFVSGKFPSNEPMMSSLMVSTDRFTASVIFFVGDSNNVVSTCFSAPVPIVGDDVAG